MKIEIIYEDDNIIAFNKPSGLLSIPDRFDAEKPHILKVVGDKYGKLFVVHRLDRDTSGVICFAKNENTHKHLSGLFQDRKVTKYYQALVHGSPAKPEDDIQLSISESKTQRGKMMINRKGKTAHTRYTVLQSWSRFSLLHLQIFTGRTHQIRVHLQYIGTPIICDNLYGSESQILLSSIKKGYKLSKEELEEKPIINRLGLHSSQIIMKDEAGKEINITAPLPKDMSAFINQLNKNS